MRILLAAVNSKRINLDFELKCLYSVVAEEDCLLSMQAFSANENEVHIFGELLSQECDVLCFPCHAHNIAAVLRISEYMKKASPGLIIVLLGPEVSYDAPEMIEQNPQIDIIIEGEAEGTFLHLCKAFSDKQYQAGRLAGMLAGIKGISYRTDTGDIVRNPQAPPLIVESLPFPYNYFEALQDDTVCYESTRGCPYPCSYCLLGSRDVRQLSPERVKQELSYFLYKKVKKVKLKDSIFNYDVRRAYELWEYLITADNGITCFQFKIRTELLDEGTFSLLSRARPGLFEFEAGIQSTNRQALNSVGRSTDIPAAVEMAQRLLTLGNVTVKVNLIAGLPFDHFDTFKRTFNEIYCLYPDKIKIHLLMLLKGTDLRRCAAVYGYEAQSHPPYEVIANKFISANEVYQIRRIAHMVALYYNKGLFQETMAFMVSAYGKTPFDFYSELADRHFEAARTLEKEDEDALARICLSFAQAKEQDLPGSLATVKRFLTKDMKRSLDFDEAKGPSGSERRI